MVRPHFSDLIILVVGDTTIICQSLDQWIYEILFHDLALRRLFQHPVSSAAFIWCGIELNQWDLWSYSPLCYFLHRENSSLIPCNGMCDPILVNQALHMLSSNGAHGSIVGKGSKSISEVWAILVRTDHLLFLSRGWYVNCSLCSEAQSPFSQQSIPFGSGYEIFSLLSQRPFHIHNTLSFVHERRGGSRYAKGMWRGAENVFDTIT